MSILSSILELYFITALCSHIAHIINNCSIATIKASFIVSLDRLMLIDYCITNPAVIKYSSNALRTILCSLNYSAILPYSNKAIPLSLREAYISQSWFLTICLRCQQITASAEGICVKNYYYVFSHRLDSKSIQFSKKLLSQRILVVDNRRFKSQRMVEASNRRL